MTDREKTSREAAFIQETIAKLPKGPNGEELLSKEFPPIAWVIPGFITTGLTIIAGAPKLGKSWLILGIACALSVGGRVLGYVEVEKCDVLFLALEDTERRLKERLRRMQVTGIKNLHLRVTWPSRVLAVQYLNAWMLANPGTRIIFIDTLQKISGVEDSNSYRETYNAAAELKRIADRYSIAIVVIHHTSKVSTTDFVHSVNGSVGLTGAADTVITIDRPRGQNDGVLKITGRDVEENEIGIRFDPDVGTWVKIDEVPSTPSVRSRGKDAASGEEL
jgi:RecA-family ATPase